MGRQTYLDRFPWDTAAYRPTDDKIENRVQRRVSERLDEIAERDADRRRFVVHVRHQTIELSRVEAALLVSDLSLVLLDLERWGTREVRVELPEDA